MALYILRRVAWAVPVFFGVTLVLFLIATVLPGDPVMLRGGERGVSPGAQREMRRGYGLDRPWIEQYGRYLVALSPVHYDEAQRRWELDGPDLGTSISTGRPVNEMLAESYPHTVRLSLAALFVEVLFGVVVGVVSYVRRGSVWDTLMTLVTSLAVAVPTFWLGLLLQYVFGIWLKRLTGGAFYLPVSGASGPLFHDWVHLILPALTLAAASTAFAARIVRTELLEVSGADHVRTARAKGLSRRQVLVRHELRNALVPLVTFIGIDLGAMLSGAVVTEAVFDWPGIGFTLFRAIAARDHPVVFGAVIVVLFAVMLVNLLVDVACALLDPRIRLGASAEV